MVLRSCHFEMTLHFSVVEEPTGASFLGRSSCRVIWFYDTCVSTKVEAKESLLVSHLYLLLSWYVYPGLSPLIPLIQVFFFQFRAFQLLHLLPCV